MKAYIRVLQDGKPAAEFPIGEPAEIGRAHEGWGLVLRAGGRETSLGVSDGLVSRRHALLYVEGESLLVRDAGSANGTMLNEKLLPGWERRKESQPCRVGDGCVLRLGNTCLEVRLESGASYDQVLQLVREMKLEMALARSHPAQDARRLAGAFRVILDISETCCNTGTRVRELQNRLDSLKGYISDEALAAEVRELQLRVGAQLFEGECLHQQQVDEVRGFCRRLVERWGASLL